MTSIDNNKFPIPDNFEEILHEYIKNVIKYQPKNIAEFSYEYFKNLEKNNCYENNQNDDIIDINNNNDYNKKKRFNKKQPQIIESQYVVGINERIEDLMAEARMKYQLSQITDDILFKAIKDSGGNIDEAINNLVKYF